MFVEITRMFTVVLLTAAGYWLARDIQPGAGNLAGIGGMLGCLAGYLSGGLFGRLIQRAAGIVERRVDRLPGPQAVAGIFGAASGAVAGAVVMTPLLVFVDPRISVPIAGLVVWCAVYLGFRITAHKSEDLFAMIGVSTRPLVRARPYDHAEGFVVDSSAVMDGQLLPLARSGLFRDDLLVPRFVLDELQGMADAGDERARRARRGLETLEVLRKESPLRVYVLDDEVPEVAEVDAKLVALARRLQLRLLTNDLNLSKVAEIQGVPTVIPRRLAADMVPGILPGEMIVAELTRTGRHPGQGVGYLDDGSMLVVNGGADLVGAGSLSFSATSIVPTNAGRIVFARVLDERRPHEERPRTPPPSGKDFAPTAEASTPAPTG